MSRHHLSGLSAWLVQRLSAIYMALFSIVIGGAVLMTPEINYSMWRALFAQPLVTIATTIFFLSLLLHTWVGVRDVILDYAGHFPAARLLLLSLLGIWLIGLGVWVIRIMLRVMLP